MPIFWPGMKSCPTYPVGINWVGHINGTYFVIYIDINEKYDENASQICLYLISRDLGPIWPTLGPFLEKSNITKVLKRVWT